MEFINRTVDKDVIFGNTQIVFSDHHFITVIELDDLKVFQKKLNGKSTVSFSKLRSHTTTES